MTDSENNMLDPMAELNQDVLDQLEATDDFLVDDQEGELSAADDKLEDGELEAGQVEQQKPKKKMKEKKPRPPKASKGKSSVLANVIKAVIMVLVLAVLGAGGWIAYNTLMLDSKGAFDSVPAFGATQQHDDAGDAGGAGTGFGLEQGQSSSAGFDSFGMEDDFFADDEDDLFADDEDELLADDDLFASAHAQTAKSQAQGFGMQDDVDLVVPYKSEEEKDDVELVAQDKQVPELTEEEKMYDALLDSAQELDVPFDAIKIDRSVIEAKERERRVSQVEKAITQTQSEIKEINQSIEQTQKEVAQLMQAITANDKKTAEIGKNIDQIREMVVDRLDGFDKKLNEMEKKAQVAAKPAPKPQAKPAPAKAAAPKQQVAKAAPKPAPAAKAPASKPAVAKAAPKKAAPAKKEQPQPTGCTASSRVSKIWRVAGANSVSAYLMRATDRTGLLVKPGREVPGFGVVLSIDVNARTVCTSSGLIKR